MKKKIAFLSTSFGFGPVSKAVTVANEIKLKSSNFQLDYFGKGIDLEFAIISGSFNNLLEVNVDNKDELMNLIPILKTYDLVIAVLTLDLLPLWTKGNTKLYFIDSLAWMWNKAPLGIENVDVYFIQDYLFSDSDNIYWVNTLDVPYILISPIEATQLVVNEKIIDSGRLLVNFSGCINPFVDLNFYTSYVDILSEMIIECADHKYFEIIFCCNSYLSEYLKEKYNSSKLNIKFGHFSHEKFLNYLATSTQVFTSPGITTTLEAMKLNKNLKYLLPQNYSQNLILEQYKNLLPLNTCMPLSLFGNEFLVPPGLDESMGVKMVLNNLYSILSSHKPKIKNLINEFLNNDSTSEFPYLTQNIKREWNKTGQDMVTEYCI